MDQISLKADARTDVGSAASRRLRRAGRIPCVVYGDGDTLHLTVDAKSLHALVESHRHVIDLDEPDRTSRAQLKELQWDTYGDRILHADFARIRAGEAIEVNVSLEFFGRAKGVEEGGVLETPNDTLLVEGQETSLPEQIEIDVQGLGIGDILRVSDLTPPEGCVFLDDPDTIVAHVVAATTEDEEREEAEPGPAEPEVIRGRAAEEEEEG